MCTDKNPDSRVLFLGDEGAKVPEYALLIADCFKFFRHDLQNDLQIVYGYLQLEKSREQVVAKLDKVTERILTASHIFNLNNVPLSCFLFVMWAQAEQSGMRFMIETTGRLEHFGANWPSWEHQLATLWTYYRGLAVARGQKEVLLELTGEHNEWQVCFGGKGAVQIICTSEERGMRKHVY